jgi:hypothetical protein
MNRKTFLVASLALFTLGLLAGGARAQYTATILNPLPFEASAQGAAGGTQVGGVSLFGGISHALLWSGSAASVVDLHPAGFDSSYARGISGNSQVGEGFDSMASQTHALLWSGSAASVVDLHPVGFDNSFARGVHGGTQVGFGGATGSGYHALLWSGSAASAVDLHPAGFDDTFANGVYGTFQVGQGFGGATGGDYHALLWSGSATSVVDLHPVTGFLVTGALGISGSQIIGQGLTDTGDRHALLWDATTYSLTDLNPTGISDSYGYGVYGGFQVGWGSGVATGGDDHAFLWAGSAASAVDLHDFLTGLPVAMLSSSAYGIDSNGDIVGRGFDSDGNAYALLWKSTASVSSAPEPTTLALLSLGGTLVVLRRRSQK